MERMTLDTALNYLKNCVCHRFETGQSCWRGRKPYYTMWRQGPIWNKSDQQVVSHSLMLIETPQLLIHGTSRPNNLNIIWSQAWSAWTVGSVSKDRCSTSDQSVLGVSLTSITVRLHAIPVLQSVTPGALVPGRCVQALPDSVTALEPVSPLSPVNPPPLRFYAESVAFPLCPVALVHVSAGPGVDTDHFKPVGPRARVLALALGAGTHPMAVGFAVLPASAVRATIVKVEPTARHSETEGFCTARRLMKKSRVCDVFLDARKCWQGSPGDTWSTLRGSEAAGTGGGGVHQQRSVGYWDRDVGGREAAATAATVAPKLTAGILSHSSLKKTAEVSVMKQHDASCLTFQNKSRQTMFGSIAAGLVWLQEEHCDRWCQRKGWHLSFVATIMTFWFNLVPRDVHVQEWDQLTQLRPVWFLTCDWVRPSSNAQLWRRPVSQCELRRYHTLWRTEATNIRH